MAIRLFLAGNRAPRALVRNVRNSVFSVKSHVLAHRILVASTVAASKTLRQCPVPILYLIATRDRLVGARSARRIRRVRADISIQAIDAPHLLLQVQPQQAWQAIQQFLQEKTYA
jgi:pimeloyl-ACP methyl ester carboxylesterase